MLTAIPGFAMLMLVLAMPPLMMQVDSFALAMLTLMAAGADGAGRQVAVGAWT